MANRVSQLIAPSFFKPWGAIKKHLFTHFWFPGGRGSTKSSFISIAIVLLMNLFPNLEVIVFRKVADSLRETVFAQMLWAFDVLGMTDRISTIQKPLTITMNTGQRIIFKGLDDTHKLKSLKPSPGRYFGIGWFEELDEFDGMEEIRKVIQSIMRGNFPFWFFYSYNPPITNANWTNQEVEVTRIDKVVYPSCYLDVDPDWLGEGFLNEAMHLKKRNIKAYQHEYLGKVVGTGGTIFPNVQAAYISDKQIADQFDTIRQGLDWGYTTDPFVYIKSHFDKKHRDLYIFEEIVEQGMSNFAASKRIKKVEFTDGAIRADSSEPKSIDEMVSYGHWMEGVVKGAGSVEYGIKFMQSLDHIYIDKERCPYAYTEFTSYELLKRKNGGFNSTPPDKNNHTIDGVRYSLEEDMESYAW